MPPSIPFNRPFIIGKELYYIAQAVTFGNIAGDGHFTQRCSQILEGRFGVPKVLMTPSCTAALEMAALLAGLEAGDEVILPSYTFVSTANAIVRVGARPVFVDVRPDTLNIDEARVESALTARTRAIFTVHYAGVACAMDAIMDIAGRRNLLVVEDAAQGLNASYRGRPLGAIGHLGAYSFHETKNYMCGEGGALCVNAPEYTRRADIIRDKGTNRKEFLRGEVERYTWVDVGSSYVPSELACAFLCAQLEHLDEITQVRRRHYDFYRSELASLASEGLLGVPTIPRECGSNYHIFYILLPDRDTRDALAAHLREDGILAVIHYVPLHSSPMGKKFGYRAEDLPVTEDLAGRLLRLPLFHEITEEGQARIVARIRAFVETRAVQRGWRPIRPVREVA